MRRSTLLRKRLAAVFLMGAFLLYSPAVSLFEGGASLFGVPLLYYYLFGVWILVIAAAAWNVERGRE